MTTVNKTCSLTIDMSYTAVGGAVVSAPRTTVAAKYESYEEGIVAVPAATTASTAYTLAFGAIAVKATMLVIKNVSCTGPIGVKINGASTAAYTLDVGGVAVIGGPAAVGVTNDVPVTSATVIIETVQGATAGEIDYLVFGDPV